MIERGGMGGVPLPESALTPAAQGILIPCSLLWHLLNGNVGTPHGPS